MSDLDNDGILDLDTVADAVPAWQQQAFTLAEYPEKLALVKLAAGAEVPRWAESSSIFSITATATETSLICAGRSVPTKTPSIKPLIAFRITGEIDEGAIGVLAGLLVPLAEIGVPAYTFSTYETDWIMVRVVDAAKAAEEWRRRGHTVAAAVPINPPKSSAAANQQKKAPQKGKNPK
ncbi:ACT domain-containing protein [Nocardioides jiangxiensis]|uniref:ACT domain-containing protein n=1 Tax=Nocardioides jiangxiensis TaxID=3064524 RepID=A0ABT9B5S8_9ACTN|nr:ACT domain-containing protein [Nocardioides sp. WY-20]MDO7869654.1 ACT domain-containing protein [Nocardioides sp. WY-20]